MINEIKTIIVNALKAECGSGKLPLISSPNFILNDAPERPIPSQFSCSADVNFEEVLEFTDNGTMISVKILWEVIGKVVSALPPSQFDLIADKLLFDLNLPNNPTNSASLWQGLIPVLSSLKRIKLTDKTIFRAEILGPIRKETVRKKTHVNAIRIVPFITRIEGIQSVPQNF